MVEVTDDPPLHLWQVERLHRTLGPGWLHVPVLRVLVGRRQVSLLMKLDDLLDADNSDLDEDLLAALTMLGFVDASYTLYQRKPSSDFVAVITGHYHDGSAINWIGQGTTPEDARTNAIDAIAKWILNQNVFHPQSP